MYLFSVSLEVKHCNIPCPNDCKMAQWSEWSKCPSKCRPGIQKRSRYIEQLNSAGGRQCPSLDSTQTETQTRLCHPECSQYIWKAYEWSMCDSSSRTCGDGTQRRVVNCVIVNVNGDTTGITTEDNCAGQVKPHSEQQCRLACVGECVMSDWTEWTECPRVSPSYISLFDYTHCIIIQHIKLNRIKSIRFHVLVCVGKNCVFQSQIIKILDLDIVLFLHTAMLKRIPKTDSYS